eukprot:scaffold4445_cov132-Cylindrotheca_fusiformis.AAC.10
MEKVRRAKILPDQVDLPISQVVYLTFRFYCTGAVIGRNMRNWHKKDQNPVSSLMQSLALNAPQVTAFPSSVKELICKKKEEDPIVY